MDGADEKAKRSSAAKQPSKDLIPRDFLKVIAVWSLIPSYLAAGGFIGYLIDRWLGIFPYVTGVGFLVALGMAVWDMWRLREGM